MFKLEDVPLYVSRHEEDMDDGYIEPEPTIGFEKLNRWLRG